MTRGAPLSWTHLISSLRPAEQLFTGILESQTGNRSLVGQIYQSPYLPNAHLTYLLAPADQSLADLPILLDELSKTAGTWSATSVVAEVNQDSTWFTQFRQTGFSVFAKQRVFKFDGFLAEEQRLATPWRIWTSADINAMRSLYLILVPPLMQSVEPLTRMEMLGMVYYDPSGSLQAFADLVYGPVGAWVIPFVHPQSSVDLTDLFSRLLVDMPNLHGRPVYLVARSYQPWIESALENMEAQRGPEQVVMVRHLARRERVPANLGFQRFENGKTEPTYPIATSEILRQ